MYFQILIGCETLSAVCERKRRDNGTYVDNGPVPELSPGEVVDYMTELEAGAFGEAPHGVAEPTGALRELRKHLVDGSFRAVRQGESLRQCRSD